LVFERTDLFILPVIPFAAFYKAFANLTRRPFNAHFQQGVA
jgi:hypothetical protein